MKTTSVFHNVVAFCLILFASLPVSLTASVQKPDEGDDPNASIRIDIPLEREKEKDNGGIPRRLPAPVSASYDHTYLYIATPTAVVEYAVTASDEAVVARGVAATVGGEVRVAADWPAGAYTVTLTVDGVTYEGEFDFGGAME